MRMHSLATVVLAIGGLSLALAQAPRPAATLAQTISRGLTQTANEVSGAAGAMPAAKYDFAPSPNQGNFAGVRTFAQEVKHIASANYSYGAAILGEKPPVDLGSGENGPDSLASKEQIVKFLRDSFAYAQHAIASITPGNALQPASGGARSSRLAVAIGIAPHCMDHYGQMVEYLRMNGLTPPASANSAPANPKKNG